MTSHRLVLSVLAVATAASSNAIAQIPGAMTWQVSLDDGATWLGGDVPVSPSQSSVRVRLMASWGATVGGASPPVWFVGTTLDPFVANVGLADTIGQVRRRSTSGYALVGSSIVVQRFADMLKIDQFIDTALPGQGQAWLTTSQGTEFIGVFEYGNPIEMLSYSLTLDGSIGVRTITGAWATLSGTSGLPSAFLSTGQTVMPTFHDARIIVPTPGAAGLAGVAAWAAFARPRRREA
jgi:hypothetical protein